MGFKYTPSFLVMRTQRLIHQAASGYDGMGTESLAFPICICVSIDVLYPGNSMKHTTLCHLFNILGILRGALPSQRLAVLNKDEKCGALSHASKGSQDESVLQAHVGHPGCQAISVVQSHQHTLQRKTLEIMLTQSQSSSYCGQE